MRQDTTMQAIRYHEFGGPDVLRYETVPLPQVAQGEVLVKVHAAGVNPADWKTVENRFRQVDSTDLPLIPGWDISGEVIALTGVDTAPYKAGDLVYGMLRFPRPGLAYAEYVSAPLTDLAKKPQNLSHLEAAVMPLAGLTAWQMLSELLT